MKRGQNMKVLLVEDDSRLGRATKELLELENCVVDWARDGSEALQYFETALYGSYDIIILDWMLPELSGVEICRILRQKYHFQGGIIFVTAKGEVEDCIRALEQGADDYMVKPFKIKELVARLKAVCRRKSKPFIDDVYMRGSITIDRNLKAVVYKNQKLVLRKKEFALFELLFVNLNNVLPRAAIFEKIWDDKVDTNMESLDSHIYTLRKKIKILLPQVQIKSVKNIGYVMEIENND